MASNTRYIVVLKPGVSHATHWASLESDSSLRDPRVKVLKGKQCGIYPGDTDVTGNAFYVAVIDDKSTVKELKEHADVKHVLADIKLQSDASWAQIRLARPGPVTMANPIGSHNVGNFNRGPYTGNGVCAYVIDEGCDDMNAEFDPATPGAPSKVSLLYRDHNNGGRWTEFNRGAHPAAARPNGLQPLNRHGSMVTGLLCGANLGVAVDAEVFSISWRREMEDFDQTNVTFAYLSAVILSLAEIYERHGPGGARSRVPAVVNMSNGFYLTAWGENTAWLDDQLNAIINSGIIIVNSAGNDAVNADDHWPSYMPNVVAVGATDCYDEYAGYSNWGRSVDIWAPGTWVFSIDHNNGVVHDNGTSLAAPLVAGVVCLTIEHLQAQRNPQAINFANVSAALYNNASTTAKLRYNAQTLVQKGTHGWPTRGTPPQDLAFADVVHHDRIAFVPQ